MPEYGRADRQVSVELTPVPSGYRVAVDGVTLVRTAKTKGQVHLLVDEHLWLRDYEAKVARVRRELDEGIV